MDPSPFNKSLKLTIPVIPWATYLYIYIYIYNAIERLLLLALQKRQQNKNLAYEVTYSIDDLDRAIYRQKTKRSGFNNPDRIAS